MVLAEDHSFIFNGSCTTPHHNNEKSFQWGKNQQKDFDEIKRNINQAPVLMLPNLKNPFKVEKGASGYAMGAFFMQGGRIVSYHSKIFHAIFLNFPTYEKEIYASVQAIKKRNPYLMGKDTIIHTDHQSLQYL
jgi:hypothetical protein